MKLLTDKELANLILGQRRALLDVPMPESTEFGLPETATSAIQPCSIDLTIDEICLPSDGDAHPSRDFDPKSVMRTRRHTLRIGECVRVFTRERFDFRGKNSDLTAFLFAPARISRRGILVMDTSIVDPGFYGNVSFTIINFGSKPFVVEQGNPIATAIIFQLDDTVGKEYSKLGDTPYERRYEAVGYLPQDFLGVVKQVEMRTEGKIKDAIRQVREDYFRNVVIPILCGAIAGMLAGLIGAFAIIQSEAWDLDHRVAELEKAAAAATAIQTNGQVPGPGGKAK